MMTMGLPQNRAITTNTGSMAEMWLGAMTKPLSWMRFSLPMTLIRNAMCHTSHANGTMIQ